MKGKLLLDQNPSRRLVTNLQTDFPGTIHVAQAKLSLASDKEIWEYAQKNEFCILSKDADFHHMSLLFGAPPKIIWLRLGNCSTDDLQNCLTKNKEVIRQFLNQTESSILLLS